MLRAACDAAGLDGAALMAAVDDERVRRLGVDALEKAHRDEVFGIPLFLVALVIGFVGQPCPERVEGS